METTITPRFVSSKRSKAGKEYWEVEDVQGVKYTIHDQELMIKMQINVPVNIDFSESGDWKNIHKVIAGNISPQSEPVESSARDFRAAEREKFAEPKKEKLASVLTSYAKDLVCQAESHEWADKDLTIEDAMLTANKAVLAAYQELLKKL